MNTFACEPARQAGALLFSLVVIVAPAAIRAQGLPVTDTMAVLDTAGAAIGRLAGARSPIAESPSPERLAEITVDDAAVSRWRLRQLSGAPSDGFLLRSTGTLLEGVNGGTHSGWRLIRPGTRLVLNTSMPVSANDGVLWAGQGASSITTFGARLDYGWLQLVLAPQVVLIGNSDWSVRDTLIFWSPDPAPGRVGRDRAFSWYQGQFSIDLPQRFGSRPITRVDPGQSSVYARIGLLEAGVATENNWWGPGVRNALVLSNAAPGFYHLFFRSGRPWSTPIGSVEWRWLVGGLEESDYFDTDLTNDYRSLSAAAVTLRPGFSSNLTVGLSRSVISTETGWSRVAFRWFEVFRATERTTQPLAWDDPGTPGGREQIVAAFFRYVMPTAGSEFYGEWGRAEFPTSLRDFLVSPHHTQAYTLGFQWSRPMRRDESRFRVQGEVTTLEQSATFRDRAIGTWYASRRVVQGYTHRGEMLGAAIGPGSSAQWLALDYLTPGSALGAYMGRTRWNEDIHSQFAWPDYMRYCNHDVSTEWGVRGERRGGRGLLAVDVGVSNRRNAFFQRAGCFGPTHRDIRNLGLKISVAPYR